MDRATTEVTPEPLSLVQRVDSICYRFETEWIEGKRPRIEDYLDELPAPERVTLLRELILLEADYRRREQQTPDPREYAARFPTIDADWLSSALTAAEVRPVTAARPAGGVRYRILRPHARGGLGAVFVARDEELRREVALKEILPDRAADPRSRTRFISEAEITAGLEHPGVVPIYGLGAYPDGRPFYAMRFIQGDSLLEAIRRFHEADRPGRDLGERGLAFRQLLRRFIDVCNTIAYAHSRGVVHRDLKPANVMLGPFGETLVVDWGLAKAAAAAAVDANHDSNGHDRAPVTTFVLEPGITGAEAAVGTPAYMSPEQAAGQSRSNGPASDVYSLGATLYHVLTGHAPIQGIDLGDVLQKVQRGEVPRLRLIKAQVPGALEAICLKAIALDPVNRYPSALALANDLEHWLADEPIGAWREPWTTMVRRWARRHRALVASTLAMLTAAVVLLSVAALLLDDARSRELEARLNEKTQREAAQEAQAQAQAAERQAQADRRQAEIVVDFLIDAFRSPDPRADGRQVKIVDVLDRVSGKLGDQSAYDSVTRAKLLNALGRTYVGLGIPARAVNMLEQARDLRRDTLGSDHPETIGATSDLARAFRSAGRLTEAGSLFEAVYANQKARLGPSHPVTLTALGNLAAIYSESGRPHDAVPLNEELLRVRQASLGDDHPDTLSAMNNLALAYQRSWRLVEALPLFDAALEMRRAKLGPDHPDTLMAAHNLAIAYLTIKRPEQAVPIFEEVLQKQTVALGSAHGDTLRTMNSLAAAYDDVGRKDDAVRLLEMALTKLQTALGPDHPQTVLTTRNLLAAHRRAKRVDDVIRVYEEMWRLQRGQDKPNYGIIAEATHGIGMVLLEQNKCIDAEKYLREWLTALEQLPDNWGRCEARSLIGAALVGQEKYEAAEPLLLAGYEGLIASADAVPAKELAAAVDRIVRLYQKWGKTHKATEWRAKQVPDKNPPSP